MNPEARSQGILAKTVDSELVVYDEERHRAHSLNATAAFVWKHADGRRTTGEIARLLAAHTDTPVHEDVVHLAVADLAAADLLTKPAGALKGVSRRDALRRAATVAGLALIPVVTTIVAPTPADAQSEPIPKPLPPATPIGGGHRG